MSPIVSETDEARTNAAGATEKAAAAAAVSRRRTRRAAKDNSATGRRSAKADSTPPPSRRRVRVAEGIYKDRHGLAATVKVNGIQREIRFPAGTPHPPRCGPRASDSRVEDGGSASTDALDGDAAVANGAPDPRRFPYRRADPVRRRTARRHARRTATRSRCIKFGIRSRRGSGTPRPISRTSGICTGIRMPKRRGSTRRRRSPSSGTRSGDCGRWTARSRRTAQQTSNRKSRPDQLTPFAGMGEHKRDR